MGKTVCGGDVVRIYHFELQSFLVGRPNDTLLREEDNPTDAILSNLENEDTIAVSMRKTKAVMESKNSRGFNSLFLVEKASSIIDGSAITYSENIRLRHL